MRLAAEALATDPGPIHAQLQAAEPHFGRAFEYATQRPGERHLWLRIGAGLVEGGDEVLDDADECDAGIVESIALLDQARAVELAGDMLRLYELVAGLRSDGGYGWETS